jgi:hypothetical protein
MMSEIIQIKEIRSRLRKIEEQLAKHEKFLPRYWITPSGNVVIDEVQPKAEKETSKIPCCLCGGKVIEFTVPNEVWNKVMRPDGKETDKEYICYECWNKKLNEFLLPHLAEEVKEQPIHPDNCEKGYWFEWCDIVDENDNTRGQYVYYERKDSTIGKRFSRSGQIRPNLIWTYENLSKISQRDWLPIPGEPEWKNQEQPKPQKPATGELWWYQWYFGTSVPCPWISWDGKTQNVYRTSGELYRQHEETIPPDENLWIRCSMPEVIRKRREEHEETDGLPPIDTLPELTEADRKKMENIPSDIVDRLWVEEEKSSVVATGSTAFIAESQSLKERIAELEGEYSRLETRSCHLTRTIVKWRIISERRGKTIYQLQNLLSKRNKMVLELMGVHSEGNEPTAEDVFMGDYYEKSLKRIAELEKQLAELQIDGRIESDGLKKQLAASQRDAEAFRTIGKKCIDIDWIYPGRGAEKNKIVIYVNRDGRLLCEKDGITLLEAIEKATNEETKIENRDCGECENFTCRDNTNPKQPDPSSDLPKSEPSWPKKIFEVESALWPKQKVTVSFDPLHSEFDCWRIVEELSKKISLSLEFLHPGLIIHTNSGHHEGHGSTLAEQLVDAAYQWAKGEVNNGHN